MLENCARLGFYEAYGGCSLPTFRDMAPSSRVQQSGLCTAGPVNMAPTGCHETSVTKFYIFLTVHLCIILVGNQLDAQFRL